MHPKQILARAGKEPATGEMLLYGDIGPAEWGMIDDKAFADELKKLGDVKTIQLRIDSAGGSAFTGISIYNQLQRHPARIEVTVDGIAASIASIIAMAGDTITMGEGAQLMIHDASTISWGNAAEMERTAVLLNSISGELAKIYARRSGRHEAEFRTLMRAETWFTADEAVAAQLADRVSHEIHAAAYLDKHIAARFRHTPKALLTPRETVDNAAARASVSTMAARAALLRRPMK
jgi:ATP-dependent protease ClpP protease subunit